MDQLDKACTMTTDPKQFDSNQTFGIPSNTATKEFVEISFSASRSELKDYMHATHGMLYAREEKKLLGRFPPPANIMMQFRFDGMVGFPGGLIDKLGENPSEALNREFEEEINFDVQKHGFQESDYFMSHVNHSKHLVTHFFTKEVTSEEYRLIEKRTMDAVEWGQETFGVIRVPLFIMEDNCRGFPVYLANKFAGNAREQLLLSIKHCNILNEDQIRGMVAAYSKYIEKINS